MEPPQDGDETAVKNWIVEMIENLYGYASEHVEFTAFSLDQDNPAWWRANIDLKDNFGVLMKWGLSYRGRNVIVGRLDDFTFGV